MSKHCHTFLISLLAALAVSCGLVSPTSLSADGGTSVEITGTDFSGVSAVTFGTAAALSFTVNSTESITATAPAGSATGDVTVVTTGGTSAANDAAVFEWIANARDKLCVRRLARQIRQPRQRNGVSHIRCTVQRAQLATDVELDPVRLDSGDRSAGCQDRFRRNVGFVSDHHVLYIFGRDDQPCDGTWRPRKDRSVYSHSLIGPAAWTE